MCAARDVPEDSRTGFCDRCDKRRTLDKYNEKNAQQIDERRQRWSERTYPARSREQQEWDAERAHQSRLRRAIRPHEPVDPETDPWELGYRALMLAKALRPSLRNPRPLAVLAELEELIRQLSYGPDDEMETVSVPVDEEEAARREKVNAAQRRRRAELKAKAAAEPARYFTGWGDSWRHVG
jgi:hypothetical protein